MGAHLPDLILVVKARRGNQHDRGLSGVGAHVAALPVPVEVVPPWGVQVVVFHQVFRGLHREGSLLVGADLVGDRGSGGDR